MEITARPVALLFAGQGHPQLGMGADLWNRTPATREVWDCASDISGLDLRRLCLRGPMPRLIATPVQQLAVTAINLSLYRLLQPHIGDISAVCGHSVGEYSALYAAGVFTLEQLFAAIHFRAAVMHQLSQRQKGAMLAVKGMDYAAMRALLDRYHAELDISCDNSRCQQVVGGPLAALNRFACSVGGVYKLGVSGAWHTRLMQEGVQPMRDFLATLNVARPCRTIVMNVSGQPAVQPEAIRENLALHLTHSVRWRATIDSLLARQTPPLLIELSHKPWLSALLTDFPGFSPAMAVHCRKLLYCQ